MTHSPMRPPLRPASRQALERRVRRALAPLDARALGIALGVVAVIALTAVTTASLLMDPSRRFPLQLLGQYFIGYTVSPTGMLVGSGWAFVAGFGVGWFLATARNLFLALWLLKVRVRADLDASNDVLDHI